MKMLQCNAIRKAVLLLAPVFFLNITALSAQADGRQGKSEFWSHVQFGGGVGLSIGTGYTDITLAPGAIYNFNDYFAMGLGLQGTYVKVNNRDMVPDYNAWLYGASVLALVNPIDQIQLSVEVEQLRVNSTYKITGEPEFKDNFWNTALFLGAGYRVDNFTIGARYNVLFDEDKRVYADGFMPFVRMYF